jgi:hypothetical protein
LFNGSKIIVEKSTVPVSTADAMTCVLQANAPPGINFQVHKPYTRTRIYAQSAHVFMHKTMITW